MVVRLDPKTDTDVIRYKLADLSHQNPSPFESIDPNRDGGLTAAEFDATRWWLKGYGVGVKSFRELRRWVSVYADKAEPTDQKTDGGQKRVQIYTQARALLKWAMTSVNPRIAALKLIASAGLFAEGGFTEDVKAVATMLFEGGRASKDYEELKIYLNAAAKVFAENGYGNDAEYCIKVLIERAHSFGKKDDENYFLALQAIETRRVRDAYTHLNELPNDYVGREFIESQVRTLDEKTRMATTATAFSERLRQLVEGLESRKKSLGGRSEAEEIQKQIERINDLGVALLDRLKSGAFHSTREVIEDIKQREPEAEVTLKEVDDQSGVSLGVLISLEETWDPSFLAGLLHNLLRSGEKDQMEAILYAQVYNNNPEFKSVMGRVLADADSTTVALISEWASIANPKTFVGTLASIIAAEFLASYAIASVAAAGLSRATTAQKLARAAIRTTTVSGGITFGGNVVREVLAKERADWGLGAIARDWALLTLSMGCSIATELFPMAGLRAAMSKTRVFGARGFGVAANGRLLPRLNPLGAATYGVVSNLASTAAFNVGGKFGYLINLSDKPTTFIADFFQLNTIKVGMHQANAISGGRIKRLNFDLETRPFVKDARAVAKHLAEISGMQGTRVAEDYIKAATQNLLMAYSGGDVSGGDILEYARLAKGEVTVDRAIAANRVLKGMGQKVVFDGKNYWIVNDEKERDGYLSLLLAERKRQATKQSTIVRMEAAGEGGNAATDTRTVAAVVAAPERAGSGVPTPVGLKLVEPIKPTGRERVIDGKRVFFADAHGDVDRWVEEHKDVFKDIEDEDVIRDPSVLERKLASLPEGLRSLPAPVTLAAIGATGLLRLGGEVKAQAIWNMLVPEGVTPIGDGRVLVSIWAPSYIPPESKGDSAEEKSLQDPKINKVELVIKRGPDEIEIVPLGDKPDKLGNWHGVVANMPAGTRYMFRVKYNGYERSIEKFPSDPNPKFLPDPHSRAQERSAHGWSVVVDPKAFDWGPDPKSRHQPRPFEEAVIYKLHVGTYTMGGTFKSMMEGEGLAHLKRLKEMGVNTIELLVNGFAGNINWGYDGVLPLAIQQSYGRPEDLKLLVKTLHEMGFSVVFDIVFNHLGSEGNYFGSYAPRTEWEGSRWGASLDYHGRVLVDMGPGQGKQWIPNPARQYAVRQNMELVRRVLRMYMEEYGADGFRFDMTVHIADFTYPRRFFSENAFMIKMIHSEAKRIDPAVLLICEDSREQEEGPSLFERTGIEHPWKLPWHHGVFIMLGGGFIRSTGRWEDPYGQGDLNMDHLADLMIWGVRRLGRSFPPNSIPQGVAYIDSHDEARANGRFATRVPDRARRRMARAFLFASRDVPMFWMGDEFFATDNWTFFRDGELESERDREKRRLFPNLKDQYDDAERVRRSCVLLPRNEEREPIDEADFRLSDRLARLRAENPALRETDTDLYQVVHVENNRGILFLSRRDKTGGEFIIAINFSDRFYGKDWEGVVVGVPEGKYEAVLNTNSSEFGGDSDLTNPKLVNTGRSVVFEMPPRSVVFWKKTSSESPKGQ